MNARSAQTAVVCLLGFMAQARSAELPLPKDGWASWQVDAIENSPAWCCWSSWNEEVAETSTCKLDGDRQGYGTRKHTTTDAVRIYARFANGKIDKLRALAAACPVETKTPIQKLDNVTTDDSARWLVGLAKQHARPAEGHDFDEDVLAALGMHRGAIALDALSSLARTDTDVDTRQHAIFWLAQLRGIAGAEVVVDEMFNDKDPEVRKHAAFAITESKSPRISAELIRQGTTDPDSDVRAQSWFWLSQTAAPIAEEAILAAVKKDQDDHVREQGIFALSQLPDPRATKALIAAAEDRSLSREQRKRALFWLAQSQNDSAVAYLDKVLTGSTAR